MPLSLCGYLARFELALVCLFLLATTLVAEHKRPVMLPPTAQQHSVVLQRLPPQAHHPASDPSLLCRPRIQIALRMAVEVHTVHGATGATLQQAVLRQMGAVQRSYQAAAAAAAAAGVVDE